MRADVRDNAVFLRRVLVVAVLVLVAFMPSVPDLRRAMGHPLGNLGIAMDTGGRVVGVDTNAAAAGVRIGDRVDVRAMTLRDRLLLASAQHTLDAGDIMTIPLLRAGRPIVANVVTTPEPAAALGWVVFRFAFAVLFVGLGILLVLRRPSAATWAFFIFSLNGGNAPTNVVGLIGPTWWIAFAQVFIYAEGSVAAFALVVFTILLLHDGPLPVWRRWTFAATVSLALLSVAANAFAIVALARGATSAAAIWLSNVLAAVPLFAATALMLVTYYESPLEVRQRLRWVITGLLFAAATQAVNQGSTQFGLGLYALTYEQYSALLTIGALAIGATVAYAILKQRIIDVNVALSGALIYALISAIVVGAFALVELFFTRMFDQTKAGLVADICLALILGFFFNSMHTNVDRLVDALLFRSRHLAEKHIETVIRSLPHTRSREHIDRLLVEEPVKWLRLTQGRIVPVSDEHIDCGLPGSDSLASYLAAEPGALKLGEHGYTSEWSVAVGVFSHASLTAAVLYGPHRNATDLDGEEIKLLERLAQAGGTAYDRIEAESLRLQVSSLRAQVATLQARLNDSRFVH